MRLIDYIDCFECNGEGTLEVSLEDGGNEGDVKCSKCGFESPLVRGGWIIQKTGEVLDGY